MTFWLIIIAITAVVALLAFFPLLKNTVSKKDYVQRSELNKVFYFNRVQELKEDEKKGLLEDTEQLQTELQQALLQDIPAQEDVIVEEKNLLSKTWIISGFLMLLIIATLSYLKVGSWQEQEMLEKTYQKLPTFYSRLEKEDQQLSEKEYQQLIIGLRIELQEDSLNAEKWWRLGMLASSQQKGQLAFDSYTRAYKLDPTNTKYKLSYAKFLLFSQADMDKSRGMLLLKEVLRADHSNLEALSLLAFQYFEKEEYKKAIATWSMMLRLVPQAHPKVSVITKSILLAEEKLKQ